MLYKDEWELVAAVQEWLAEEERATQEEMLRELLPNPDTPEADSPGARWAWERIAEDGWPPPFPSASRDR